MFGSKKDKRDLAHTLIAENTKISGDVHFVGSLDIEGHIQGDIYANEEKRALVSVLPKGRVTGEIRAPEVVVNGCVEGDVHSGQVYLAAKAVIRGNVNYQVIEIEKGAQIDGQLVRVDKSRASAQPEPAPVDPTQPAAAVSEVGSQPNQPDQFGN